MKGKAGMNMMENLFVVERLGRLRFQEGLRQAELNRLARQAEIETRHASLLRKVLGWIGAAAVSETASTSSRDGGRLVSSATGAGEVPGL